MKVIIAGTRTFNDYNLLKEKADFLLSKQSDVEIVSGCCRGTDKLGERYAKERGFPIKEMPADWTLGAVGGPLRNVQMAIYADALIAFWDGKSSGTAHMIREATKLRRKVKVINYAEIKKAAKKAKKEKA